MNYKSMTLDELKQDMIIDAKKGYPLFIAGALYWLAMAILGLFLEGKTLALCYLLGTGAIFPLGVGMSKLLKVNIFSRNPLSTLGGIVGGIQSFFMPFWIVIYIEHYELLPMAIGLLAASHFLPYMWIYRSMTYLLFSAAAAMISFVFGYLLIDKAFTLLPSLLTIVYLANTAGLLAETRQNMSRKIA